MGRLVAAIVGAALALPIPDRIATPNAAVNSDVLILILLLRSAHLIV